MKVLFKSIVAQIKELIFTPSEFWLKQKEEKSGSNVLWLTFMMPVLIVLAVAVFISEFFSRSDFFIEYPIIRALGALLIYILLYHAGVYISAEMMKTFGAKKDLNIARRLMVYSMTPLLLVSILTGLFPFLYILKVGGLYGFYLFWVGTRELLTFPENRENNYVIVTLAINFVVLIVLSIILTRVLGFFLNQIY